MLDPTQKESNLLSSIKKHMLDCLVPLSIPIYFEHLISVPVDDFGEPYKNWCCCVLDGYELETVSTAQLVLILFVREDCEGDDLAVLSDNIRGCFIDAESINGMKLIVLYDTSTVPWSQVGGMLPFVGEASITHIGRDSTKFKVLPVTLKWGSK